MVKYEKILSEIKKFLNKNGKVTLEVHIVPAKPRHLNAYNDIHKGDLQYIVSSTKISSIQEIDKKIKSEYEGAKIILCMH